MSKTRRGMFDSIPVVTEITNRSDPRPEELVSANDLASMPRDELIAKLLASANGLNRALAKSMAERIVVRVDQLMEEPGEDGRPLSQVEALTNALAEELVLFVEGDRFPRHEFARPRDE